MISTNAERKIYGLKSTAINPNEDVNPSNLYCWELQNLTLFQNKNEVAKTRQKRASLGLKIKILSKLIKLIEKATDLPQVANIVIEEEKLNKII